MDRPDGFSPKAPRTPRGVAPAREASKKASSVQKAAARRRKKAEKVEYRSLTGATRRRRMVWGVSVGSIGALIVGVTVLTLSPLLALTIVVVEGAERVKVSEVEQALQPFYGEPLAKVSPELIASALEPLTLIQAFTTRIEPPNTLVVSIVERKPLGVVSGANGFLVVDAAGVALWSTPERPFDLPRIGSLPDRNPASFLAATRVLSVLPPDLVAQIDTISATTLDDVRFSMRGSEHQVVWGGADRTREKARVLQASLVAAGVGEPKVIDVTTPESVVIRDQE